MRSVLKLFAIASFILIVLNIKAADDNICYLEDFKAFKTGKNPGKAWVCSKTTAKLINGSMRLSETGKNSYGTIYRYIYYRKGFNYLQIKLGAVENIAYPATTSNCSTNGAPFGKLFTGWNTFDLNAQPFYNKKNCYFALSIQKYGPYGEKDTGWIDFECIRVVKTPLNGVTIDLLQASGKNDRIARVGDKILFRYFAGKTLEKKPKLNCYYTKWMEPVLFNGKNIILNDSGSNGDLKAGDGVYSAEVKIGENTPSLTIPIKQRYFLACISDPEVKSNAIASFGFDIKTKIQLKRSSVVCGTPTTRKYRSLWQERTKGKNLALGKKVKFSATPNYSLTNKGNSNATDLTDGKLSNRSDDRIWYDKGTVGWYQGAAKGINMMIDLEKQKDIEKVIVRLLAGKPSSENLSSPKKLEVYVSRDGKNFYNTASLQKLMPAEANQSDFKKFYYLPENGIAYVYPFQLPVNADARYVLLRLTGSSGWMFLDEITVIAKEKKDKAFNAAYSGQSQRMYFSGAVVQPSKGTFFISRNIVTPCFMEVQDMRKLTNAKKKLKIELDIPEGITLIAPENQKIAGANKYIIEIPAGRLNYNPLFFKVKNAPTGKLQAKITTSCDGEPTISVNVPLQIIDIPKVPKLKRIHVSLTWYVMTAAMKYPEFFKSWEHMGFNAIGTFPRYWQGKITPDKKVFLEKARNNGMKIIFNSSPFWGMLKLKLPAGSENYTQLNGKKSKDICPSYRGKYYWQEMDRIAQCVKLVKPDYVFWDIECWHNGVKNALQCKTCREAMAKAGCTDLKKYLAVCGTEQMRDLFNAVKKGMGNSKMPVVATYDNEPLQPIYQDGLYDWKMIYPKYIELAMPSLYVAGNAVVVHKSIRENFKLMKNKKIIPWLTGGAYGEFESYKLEYMIYESLLNGAEGITYYHFPDFDTPMDYYYHAKALKTLAPLEDLIMDGKVLEPTGSNKKLYYSGVKKGNEMLLLVGNYNKAESETIVNLPFSSVNRVCDLLTSKKITSAKKLKLNVPKGKIRLLHIKGKQ